MSPDAWKRRLRKRGMKVSHLLEHGVGYAGDCTLTEWTAIVEPLDARRHYDPRFPPVMGRGHHASRDVALRAAVANLAERIENLQREVAVLALAGGEEWTFDKSQKA
jgi:hypothetical protein